MDPTLTELLTRESLRRLAGGRSFERGEEYAATGAVGSLQRDESSIRAGVRGTQRYRVRLELAGGGLASSCTCPVGRDGLFCKHCVAVGLAWLARAPQLAEPAAAPTRSELRDRLAALGAKALADLLVERALDDEYLHARLLALTADASPDSEARFSQLVHAFDVAVDPGGFVGWNEAYGFAQALEEIIDAVEQQVGNGRAAEIIAFCEHALRGSRRPTSTSTTRTASSAQSGHGSRSSTSPPAARSVPSPGSLPSGCSAGSSRANGTRSSAQSSGTPTFSATAGSHATARRGSLGRGARAPPRE